MSSRVWAAIAAAAVGFGTSGVATRAALNAGVPPYTLVTVRALGGALVVLAILVAMRRPVPLDRATWRNGLTFSVFQIALPYVLFTLAYQNASAGFVGLLAALFPLGTATIAHFALPDEPMSAGKALGLLIALAGVGVMLLSGDSGLAEGGRPVLAFGLGIVAVVSISVSGIIAKHQSHHYGVLEITGIQSALAFVWLTVVTLFVEGTPAVPTTWAMVLLGYLVLMGSVVPFLLFYWLLRHVSTTRASLIGYLVPFVALVTGIVLIDERLEAGIAIGGLLILAGVMWTDRAERKVVPRRAVVPH